MEAIPYNYVTMQSGALPLTPGGAVGDDREHRATSVLIWPHGERPIPENTVVTDPCFTAGGFEEASGRLRLLDLGFSQIGFFFVTHPHHDHMPQFPSVSGQASFQWFSPCQDGPFSGLSLVPCPGHMPELQALVFTTAEEKQVWIAGDAILDLEWLRAWKYYWPNGYSKGEIIETWKSVGTIVSRADVIVPGHGASFPVTAALIDELIDGFPSADYAADCPDIKRVLERRREELQSSEHSIDEPGPRNKRVR